jgi:hypothetical protein
MLSHIHIGTIDAVFASVAQTGRELTGPAAPSWAKSRVVRCSAWWFADNPPSLRRRLSPSVSSWEMLPESFGVFPGRQFFRHASPLHQDLRNVCTSFATDASLKDLEWNLEGRVSYWQLLLDLLTWTDSSFELGNMNHWMNTAGLW